MKKLNKLQINSEKIMKNEELFALRGGYGTGCCTCHSWYGGVLGTMTGSSPSACNSDCFSAFGTGYGTWDCVV